MWRGGGGGGRGGGEGGGGGGGGGEGGREGEGGGGEGGGERGGGRGGGRETVCVNSRGVRKREGGVEAESDRELSRPDSSGWKLFMSVKMMLALAGMKGMCENRGWGVCARVCVCVCTRQRNKPRGHRPPTPWASCLHRQTHTHSHTHSTTPLRSCSLIQAY